MVCRRLTVLILLAVFPSVLAPIFGQSVVGAEEELTVFAPFVSRLRVGVRDPQVRITWRDSEELEGGVYRVLRSNSEIVAANVAEAQVVARIQPGIETWLDTPPEPGVYHYAVLAESSDGTVHSILVPFRNKTIEPVRVTRFETEEERAAIIQNLRATVQDNGISLRFAASRGGRTIAVYRSTAPIRTADDIATATFIHEFDSSAGHFVDYPVPGIDYYYSVLDARLIERGTVEIDPGNNSTDESVRIALRHRDDRSVTLSPTSQRRRAPLPIIQPSAMTAAIRPSTEIIPFQGVAQPVSPVTEQAIRNLMQQSYEIASFRPTATILPEERTVRGVGAARTLAQIIDDTFLSRQFQEAESLLGNLLELPLSPDFARRVRFYRGQALYFSGYSERAFLELLLASQGNLYEHTRPWIDGILRERRISP